MGTSQTSINNPKIKPILIQKYASGKNQNPKNLQKYSSSHSQEFTILNFSQLNKRFINTLTSQHKLLKLDYEFNLYQYPPQPFPTTYFFSKIKNLSSLTSFHFQIHQPSDYRLLSQLKILMMNLASLKNLSNLHIFFYIDQKDPKWLKIIFKYLIKIKTLTNLSLHFFKSGDLSPLHLHIILSNIAKLLHLRSLTLTFCYSFKNHDLFIDHLTLTLPKLRFLTKFSLRFHSARGVSAPLDSTIISKLFSCLKDLKDLSDIILGFQERQILTLNENTEPISEGLLLLNSSQVQKLSFQLYQNLNDNCLTKFFQALRRFTSLQALSLDFSMYQPFHKEGKSALSSALSTLATLTSLRICLPDELEDSKIMEHIASPLKNLKNLVNLELEWTGNGSPAKNDQIQKLFSNIKYLKSLRFLHFKSSQSDIKDADLQVLGESLKKLTQLQHLSLQFSFAPLLTNYGIEVLTRAIKTLVNLSSLTLLFQNNQQFDNKTIENTTKAVQNLPHLYSVDFTFLECRGITCFDGLLRALKRRNIGEVALTLPRSAMKLEETTYLMNEKIVKRITGVS